MRRRPKESDRHVNALMTAVTILDCFRSTTELQLKDIHHRTGINKSRILRYVGSLEASGLMYFNEETGSYHLGPKLYYLGRVLENKYSGVIAAARRAMDAMPTLPGSIAYFSTRYGFDRLVLVRRNPLDVNEDIIKEGQVRPLYLGANSKVLLAYEKPAMQQRILEHFRSAPHIALPEKSLRDLASVLEQVRKDGFCVTYGETKPNFHVVSVPVFAKDKQLVGAMGLSTESGRASEPRVAEQISLLRAAADAMGRSLHQTQPQTDF